MSMRPGTYASYSIGCAAVWGVILAVGRRRLDARAWNELRVVCGGWWMGWASASIARVGYPPPKKLTAVGEKRLRVVSSGLVAFGVASAVRVFISGRHMHGRGGRDLRDG